MEGRILCSSLFLEPAGSLLIQLKFIFTRLDIFVNYFVSPNSRRGTSKRIPVAFQPVRSLRRKAAMKKVVTLKDGSEVIIRSMKRDDFNRSFDFFQALPAKDRAYLRRDVTKREVVEQRIRSMNRDRVRRLVAVCDGEIVADGALELGPKGWREHVAELRLIVAHPFQRKGLGKRMARELYLLAAKEGVEDVVVKIMRPQVNVQKIFKRLGFSEDATLRDYVKDLRGKRQDLIVMRCNLKSMWTELEEYFADTDWRRMR
jgi:L-amino acid N-acyltransferase YncA